MPNGSEADLQKILELKGAKYDEKSKALSSYRGNSNPSSLNVSQSSLSSSPNSPATPSLLSVVGTPPLSSSGGFFSSGKSKAALKNILNLNKKEDKL